MISSIGYAEASHPNLRPEPTQGASGQVPKMPRQEFLEIGKIRSVLRLYSNGGQLRENGGRSGALS